MRHSLNVCAHIRHSLICVHTHAYTTRTHKHAHAPFSDILGVLGSWKSRVKKRPVMRNNSTQHRNKINPQYQL